MKESVILIALWFALFSVLAATLTLADKILSKKQLRRIPEKHLFAVAFFGGAAAEYVTMRLIRHKTLHKRFMIGLPLIIVLHILLVAIILIK